MLIRDKALKDGNHEAEIKRIDNSSDWNLMFFNSYLYDRKEDILNYAGPTSIHLLNEFPNSIIDDKIILFFFYIVS